MLSGVRGPADCSEREVWEAESHGVSRSDVGSILSIEPGGLTVYTCGVCGGLLCRLSFLAFVFFPCAGCKVPSRQRVMLTSPLSVSEEGGEEEEEEEEGVEAEERVEAGEGVKAEEGEVESLPSALRGSVGWSAAACAMRAVRTAFLRIFLGWAVSVEDEARFLEVVGLLLWDKADIGARMIFTRDRLW